MGELLARSDTAKLDIPIGGLIGLGSFLYGLLWIGKLLDEPELVDESHQLTGLLTPERIHHDKQPRIQTGSAGAILALLALHRVSPELNSHGQAPLDIAMACGEHLIDEQVSFEGRPGAWSLSDGKPPLSGFSYGASGVSYALLQLYGACQENARSGERFFDAAQEGLAFVRQLWVPDCGNWRDVRPIFEASHETPEEGWRDWWATGSTHLKKRADGPRPEKELYLQRWCHGRSGIALGRIAGIDLNDDSQIREEVAKSLTQTRKLSRDPFFDATQLDDLCCGHMGHVETLHFAFQRLGGEENLRAALALATRVMDRARAKGSYTLSAARGRDAFAPSLFQGLAGVGYTLLRIVEPHVAPCVLVLE